LRACHLRACPARLKRVRSVDNWLVTSLDRAWEGKALRPLRIARLNRAEYANAVHDLSRSTWTVRAAAH
jgi:hypothetical protein